MNTEEAEILIRCHRPGRRPDARTEKAVRFAEGDPVLSGKLKEQAAFDDQIEAAIHYIQPPENLRQKLAEVSGKPGGKGRLLHHATLPALVGVLVLVGLAVFFVMDRRTNFQGRDAVQSLILKTGKANSIEFEPVAAPAGQMSDWFYMHGFDGYSLPPELGPLPAMFARVFKSDNGSVAQFAVEKHEMIVHVFRAGDFGVDLQGEGWRSFEHEGWAAAVRRQGGNCYLLAFRGTRAEMDDYLASLSKR